MSRLIDPNLTRLKRSYYAAEIAADLRRLIQAVNKDALQRRKKKQQGRPRAKASMLYLETQFT